jgi:5-hydroxyisourate hydrolase
MAQLTTHILDTTNGKPASGVQIVLFQQEDDKWKQVATGITNDDGRVPDLLPNNVGLYPGIYKIKFETAPYFESLQIRSFYPFVEITFYITGNEHYHVPLLLNPFGYSTYRGS